MVNNDEYTVYTFLAKPAELLVGLIQRRHYIDCPGWHPPGVTPDLQSFLGLNLERTLDKRCEKMGVGRR